ncbi:MULTISPECIES: Cof-type HAD-IIB family hydrolase [Bacillus]|uniref:Cof-type HAD-IIB family hydrolase n=1 Tax=Bacillus TaxID=1386 RepID=UPI0002FC296C|nr:MULTISPECIES: Cof-type HAD-IIB family hydrolase [Bacillus]
MPNIKAVFSDIDGTLLDSNHQISTELQETIQTITNKGTPFILVSGRMPSGIFMLQEILNIQTPIICYSGALIMQRDHNASEVKTIHSFNLATNDAQELYKDISNFNQTISFNICSYDNWFVDDLQNPWVKRDQAISKMTPQKVDFASFLEGDCIIHKVMCIGNPEDINELEAHLKKTFSHLSIFKSQASYLEIMTGGVSKATAIKQLEKMYNITRDNIMAIGDNFNDMDMLSYAGLGIAMGNAPEEVKVVANETTASNDEGGLNQALLKYVK